MKNKYIALLRGINVGGKRKILMKDLVVLMESLGYSDVNTYIQSGNIIFSAPKKEEFELKIKSIILDKYGFNVPVVVISAVNFIQYFNENPFKEEDIKKLHLVFLKEEPEFENKMKLSEKDFDPDSYMVSEKRVYLFIQGKYHESKLSNTLLEKILKVEATTRNWNTVTKLVEMAQKK